MTNVNDIARVMREARREGLRLAIVTNASLKTLKPVLKYCMGPELAAEIDVIASGEEVSHKKPAPDLYRLAMQRLGVDAADCVALEDSEMGLEAANHGMQVFGGHGYIKEHGMEQIARDARIATLFPLVETALQITLAQGSPSQALNEFASAGVQIGPTIRYGTTASPAGARALITW